MIDSLPGYRNHESRHGHNLSHDFSFTSSTAQLLTLFAHRLDPKDTIQGRIDMFTRTQPLTQPANVEIEEFIDYFFVPFEMLFSGMGDFVYQVNEPYSSITQQVLANLGSNSGKLPLLNWEQLLLGNLQDMYKIYTDGDVRKLGINVDTAAGALDHYGMDNYFFSVFRNLFHNYYNPNGLFYYVANYNSEHETTYAHPADYFQPNVMPLYLMAYNCVYEHFYRLDDREEFDSQLYNIDSAMYDGTDLHDVFSKKFFSLKYRPRFFDYFTSAKVAPLVNANNLMLTGTNTTDLTRINNYMSKIVPQLHNSNVAVSSTLGSSTGVGSNASYGSLAVDSSVLRSMFAVEKLLSVTNRAKKTYDSQVLAHLGVDMPTDYFHNIQYLGTQKSTIKVGEVVATASTEDSPLGDIAGKGYSVMGDKGVNFTAPCHGVFIGIYSAVPKVRYYAPLEKHAMITDRLSFYHPEFARLGMQPLFGYEAFAAPDDDYTANTAVLGWQMRYDELKKRFNKVSPAFVDTIVADNYSPFRQYVQTFNDWHTWTIVERPYNLYTNVVSLELKDFLASPQMLNGLMATQYLRGEDWIQAYLGTGYWLFEPVSTFSTDRHSFAWNIGSLFKRDPLLHFAKVDFKIVNKIPDNTFPSLNVM